MNLTQHFTLEEFIISQTAAREGIDNTPDERVLAALTHTALRMEIVRTLFGRPIRISSGYRSPALNKRVRGSVKSDHLTGYAVDFTIPGITLRDTIDTILKSSLQFSQIIMEYDNWIHLAVPVGVNKRQALIIDRAGTREYK